MDKKRLNIIFYIVLFGTVSFFFFSLLVSIALLLPPVQTKALNLIGGELSKIITGNIKIGRVKSNLLTYINLENVSVKHHEYPDILIFSNEIKIRYNIPALLKKQLNITSIRINRLDANIKVTEDGKYLIPFLVQSDLKKNNSNLFKDWELKLGTLRIRDLNALFSENRMKYYSAANHAKIRVRFPKNDSVSVSVTVPDGYFHSNWWNGHVDTLNTDVIIQPKGINIKHVYAKGSGSEVKGYGVIPFNYDDKWDLYVDASSKIKPVFALVTYAPQFDTTGNAQAKACFKGSFRKPLYSIDLSGTKLAYAGITLDTFRFRSHTDQKEDINFNMTGSTKSGDVKLDGKIRIKNLNSFHPDVDKYSISVKINDLQIPSIANRIKQLERFPGDDGVLNVYLEGDGYRDLPKIARIDLKAQQGGLVDTLRVNAQLHGQTWNAFAGYGNNRVNANGRYRKNGSIDGTVTGTFFNILPFVNYFLHEKVNGNCAFNAVVSGTVKSPVVAGTIQSSSLGWRGSFVDSLYASILFDKNVTLRNGFCRADVKLDSIAEFAGDKNLKGRASLRINASGQADKPMLDIRMNGENLRYKMQIAEMCDGNIKIDGFDNVLLNGVTLVKGQSRLLVNGAVDCSGFVNKTRNTDVSLDVLAYMKNKNLYSSAGSFRIHGGYSGDSVNVKASSENFDITVLNEWIDALERIKGRITATSAVCGSLRNPQCTLAIKAVKPGFDKFNISSLSSCCSFKDSLFTFDSTSVLLDSVSTLFLSGILPLSTGDGLKLEHNDSRKGKLFVQSKNFDLGYLSKVLESDWKYSGKSLVSLELTKEACGWTIEGITNVNNGMINNQALNMRGSGITLESSIRGSLLKPHVIYSVNTGKISYNNLKIDSTRFKGMFSEDSLQISSGVVSLFRGGTLFLDGVVPRQLTDKENETSGLRVNFKTDSLACTEFNIFTGSELIRDGRVSAAGTIGFRSGQPMINGKITLDKGALTIDGIDPGIGPVNAEIILKDDTVKVVKCISAWGRGSMDLIGFIVWNPEGLKDVALSGQVRNLSLDLSDIASGRIQNFNFAFSKRNEQYLLSGKAELGATRIVRDIRFNDLIEQITYANELEKEENQFLKDLNLNINVNFIENPVLDMNLGYLEFSGDMSIMGTAAYPTFIGDLSVSSGSYVLYLDRQFDVTSGHLSNYNQHVFNPTIDLNATTGVSFIGTDTSLVQDTIKLRISGQMKKIGFRLSSATSSLSEADIISILTFGQKLSSVGSDRKDLTDRIKTFAGQSLLGLGTRKLEQLLDIDRINVTGNIFDMSKEKSPTLTVTKRISPKLMVSYTTAIANLSRRKISAFYSLTKHFYLRGETENKGESGVDLIFKISK